MDCTVAGGILPPLPLAGQLPPRIFVRQKMYRGRDLPELWDFEGNWQVARRIEDALSGQEGRFDGTAAFVRDEVGLRYAERGVLTLGSATMEAERVYLWRASGDGIEVLFDDGRAFHRIDGSAEAAHWCDPDQYDVTYDFAGWPKWSSRWRVVGPRKDYVMITDYMQDASRT